MRYNALTQSGRLLFTRNGGVRRTLIVPVPTADNTTTTADNDLWTMDKD